MAVYVLIDSKLHSCKIGFSRDSESVQRRIATLQTASANKLIVAGINPLLGQSDERRLHRELSAYRTDGGREWFDLTNPHVRGVVSEVIGQDLSHCLTFDAGACSEASGGWQSKADAKCTCNCTHVSDDDECGMCEACADLMDWANECCVQCCRDLFDRDEETEDEHRRFNQLILSDRCKPPAFHLLAPYLTKCQEYRPVFAGDVVNALLDGGTKTFGDVSGACFAVHWMMQPVLDEDGDEAFPVLHLHRRHPGRIVVAYPCEFSDGMADAELLYQSLFWTIDRYSCDFFVCCVNSARDVRYVPRSVAYDVLDKPQT